VKYRRFSETYYSAVNFAELLSKYSVNVSVAKKVIANDFVGNFSCNRLLNNSNNHAPKSYFSHYSQTQFALKNTFLFFYHREHRGHGDNFFDCVKNINEKLQLFKRIKKNCLSVISVSSVVKNKLLEM
jgi:hypothetical protein